VLENRTLRTVNNIPFLPLAHSATGKRSAAHHAQPSYPHSIGPTAEDWRAMEIHFRRANAVFSRVNLHCLAKLCR
jgi:hypothetical protein